MRPKLTVGSLRGVPQPGVVLAASLARRVTAPRSQEESAPATSAPRRRCCGTGCAGCPVGERIRQLRLRRA